MIRYGLLESIICVMGRMGESAFLVRLQSITLASLLLDFLNRYINHLCPKLNQIEKNSELMELHSMLQSVILETNLKISLTP
jgi:hypothetical protein